MMKFTQRGSRLANQVKGDGVDLREAQLATFIEMAVGESLLIDVQTIDLGPIEETISSELRRGKMRLAWVYGRGLYDAVADGGLNEQPYPSPEETDSLLNDHPKGVFQNGPYIAGPYGLLEGESWRYIPARRSVAAYHCEERDCPLIHPIRLISHRTGFGRAQDVLREKLDKMRRSSNMLYEAIESVEVRKQPPYRWDNMDNLPYFLADCFSLDERRTLLERLLDGTNGTLRARCITLFPEDPIKAAVEWVASKDESQLMQITLLASDRDIHVSLNQLIWSGTLQIPTGETRSAMLVPGGAGPLRTVVQASHLGVRFKLPSMYLQLRLRALVHSVYSPGRTEDAQRLAWLLRAHDGETGPERLTSALATDDPLSIVKRLLIADERTYKESLLELGLPPGRFDSAPDEFLTELISWHIGFTSSDSAAELRDVRARTQELKQMVQALPIDALDKHQMSDVQGLAGKLFPQLEAALKRAIRFTCWAMLSDHFASGASLAYSAGAAETFFDQWIAPHAAKLDRSHAADMALADLTSCFGILGKHLQAVSTAGEQYLRPRADWPRTARDWGSPFRFVFIHTLPFLDLDAASRTRIADAITKVASGLHNEKVLLVRNSLLHDTEDFPGVDVILGALNEIDARLGQLTSFGLYPTEYRLVESDGDDVGRERVKLHSAEGSDITLLRPTELDLSAFPSRSTPQIVMPSARIDGTPEPLRFEYHLDSEFRTRWSNFPRRPKRRLSSV
jgi:hypothetical protein